jgi:queuine/archaeosine tRNA-ribosyltransferase
MPRSQADRKSMMQVETVHQPKDLARVLKISTKGKQVTTPTYFPAVSGAEFGARSHELISLVMNESYPRLLISAYDYSRISGATKKKLIGESSHYLRNGGFIMLDSGVFESYWNEDKDWTFKAYENIIPKIESDFYFAYDILPERIDKSEPEYSKSVINYAQKSAKLRPADVCIPIIHGADPKKLVGSVKRFLQQRPELGSFIAIPERECGANLSERAGTITEIRRILNTLNLQQTPLHVLGCGNPISMATYAYCGADAFDSVDWNTILVEPVELRIYDISQTELLRCKCPICKKMKDKPLARALLHNLLFYQDFVLQLQRMIRDSTLRDFLLQFLGEENLKKIESSRGT